MRCEIPWPLEGVFLATTVPSPNGFALGGKPPHYRNPTRPNRALDIRKSKSKEVLKCKT